MEDQSSCCNQKTNIHKLCQVWTFQMATILPTLNGNIGKRGLWCRSSAMMPLLKAFLLPEMARVLSTYMGTTGIRSDLTAQIHTHGPMDRFPPITTRCIWSKLLPALMLLWSFKVALLIHG